MTKLTSAIVAIPVLLCLLAACSGGVPILRSQADSRITVPTDSGGDSTAQCQALRDQIRANQESEREAPMISTSPQIVEAAEGKADLRIEELRARLDNLNCPDDTASTSATGSTRRSVPFPPAPNAPNP